MVLWLYYIAVWNIVFLVKFSPSRPEAILLAVVDIETPEEHLQVMLDCRVDFMAQTDVLLDLAPGVDGGDDAVTVVRPQHGHLPVLQAVADQDG